MPVTNTNELRTRIRKAIEQDYSEARLLWFGDGQRCTLIVSTRPGEPDHAVGLDFGDPEFDFDTVVDYILEEIG